MMAGVGKRMGPGLVVKSSRSEEQKMAHDLL
jgi:hypothetical protein